MEFTQNNSLTAIHSVISGRGYDERRSGPRDGIPGEVQWL